MKIYKIVPIVILASLIFTGLLSAAEYDLTSDALCAFGKAFLKQERYDEAKHEFKKCLMLNPQHSEASRLLKMCERKTTPEKDKAMLSALKNLEKKSKIKASLITKQKEEAIIALEKLNKISKERETMMAALPQEQVEEEKPPLEESKEDLEQEESLAPPIQKGAWTLKKGEKYAEIYTKYYWHNHQFTNGRKKKRWAYDGKGNEISTELKLEYGLTDKDTVLLYTLAKEAHWKDSFTSNTKKGVVQMSPGIKHLLFTDPFICSLQLKPKFPLDYSEEAVPALGKHQIDIETKILTAKSWPKIPGYTKFETGLRFRTEEPSNEIPYFFEFGYNWAKNLILKTTLDGQVGVGGGLNEDWLKYTIGPILTIGKLFNIEFGFGHTFAGRNSSAAKEIFTTVSRQW